MAAIYFWFPKVSGRMMGIKLGMTQWFLMTLGTALIFLPMLGLGLEGMRRRVATYTPGLGFHELHFTTLIGGILVFTGIVVMAINLVRSARRGEPAGNNPWNSRTLEWQTASPPPEENFAEIPRVVGSPYGYGVKGSVYSVTGNTPVKEETDNE
jgi:heme/copper-type cytochrome/quinol oxidase subunit 1